MNGILSIVSRKPSIRSIWRIGVLGMVAALLLSACGGIPGTKDGGYFRNLAEGPAGADWSFDDACPEVLLIGSRGSGEPGPGESGDTTAGLGKVLAAFYEELRNELSQYGVTDVRAIANPYLAYSAAAVASGEYDDSVDDGVDGLVVLTSAIGEKCGSETAVVLAGYSQGAQVTHRVVARGASGVAAAVLIANPLFNPIDATVKVGDFDRSGVLEGLLLAGQDAVSIRDEIGARVVSVCQRQDPVCQAEGDDPIDTKGIDFWMNQEEHGRYSSWLPPAAEAIVRLVVTHRAGTVASGDPSASDPDTRWDGPAILLQDPAHPFGIGGLLLWNGTDHNFGLLSEFPHTTTFEAEYGTGYDWDFAGEATLSISPNDILIDATCNPSGPARITLYWGISMCASTLEQAVNAWGPPYRETATEIVYRECRGGWPYYLTVSSTPWASDAAATTDLIISAHVNASSLPEDCSEQSDTTTNDAMPWLITREGAGPIRLGDPVETALLAGGIPWQYEFHEGGFCASYVEPSRRIWFSTWDGVVAAITVDSRGVGITGEGIRVGSSVSDLEAAYPAIYFEAAHFYVGDQASKHLRFEVGGTEVVRITTRDGWMCD